MRIARQPRPGPADGHGGTRGQWTQVNAGGELAPGRPSPDAGALRPRRLRVLLSAHACAPDIGSEPSVGWNWAKQAARDHDVWVLTWTRYRASIKREMAERPVSGLQFAYFDLPWPLRSLPLSERQMYLLWELFALLIGRRLQREVGFDVIHHLTYNTIEVPGLLWTLGPPFVWGPIGGGQVPPPSLRLYFRGLWIAEVIRGQRKRLLRFNPLVRVATHRAAAILTANEETARLIERLGPRRLINEPEIAMTLPPDAGVAGKEEGDFVIAWSGRLMPRKGPLLALDIAAELKRREVRFRLMMAGNGQWRQLILEEISSRGLEDVVCLLGHVDYSEMPLFYRRADVFLFTSLQDTSGAVLLEAMAGKLPVVALDHQGAAAIVTPSSGIKIPVSGKAAVVKDFADALELLAGDPSLRREMGEAGRQRVAECYSWEAKAELLRSLYASVAQASTSAVWKDAGR